MQLSVATSTSEPRSDGRFGERVMRRRQYHGWNQRELAHLVGITPRTLYRWEHGISVPDYGPKLRALAEALGRSPQWLLTGQEEDDD